MKIIQYDPKKEELKREGKTIREIAADLGLKHEWAKGCFSRVRKEQRQREYPRNRKNDASKTNIAERENLRPAEIFYH